MITGSYSNLPRMRLQSDEFTQSYSIQLSEHLKPENQIKHPFLITDKNTNHSECDLWPRTTHTSEKKIMMENDTILQLYDWTSVGYDAITNWFLMPQKGTGHTRTWHSGFLLCQYYTWWYRHYGFHSTGQLVMYTKLGTILSEKVLSTLSNGVHIHHLSTPANGGCYKRVHFSSSKTVHHFDSAGILTDNSIQSHTERIP